MRLLLKLVILAVIVSVFYYFFRPQVDEFFHAVKSKASEYFQQEDQPKKQSTPQDGSYQPVEKRTQ